MPHELAGIDSSASGVKVARFDVSLRGLQLSKLETVAWREPQKAGRSEDAVASEDTVPNLEIPVVEATRLQLTLRAANLAHAEAYVGFPAQLASSRQLTFPVTDIKKIEPMIGFELEDQLPRSLEDTVFDWAVTRVSRTDTELLVAASDKKQVAALVEDFAGGTVQPRAIYYEPLAYLVFTAGMENAIVADFGAERTLILHIANGRVLQTRGIRFGGNRVDEILAAELGITVDEAKRGKEKVANVAPGTAANPAAERATQALQKALLPFVIALKQMMHAHSGDAPPVLLLTGGQSLLNGLREYLAKELDVPCEPLPLPEALAAEADAHRYSLAYALAASSAVPRQPKIDFRRGEFSFRSDLSQFRAQAQRYVWAGAAVFALAFLSGIIRYATLKADDSALDKTLREVTKKVTGHEMSDYKTALVAMKQASNPEKSGVPTRSAVDFLSMLSKRIGPELDIKASELDFRGDKISLKGESANFENIDKIVEAIKTDDCFKQATLGKSHKTPDGARVEFQISIDVGCGT